MSLLKIGLTGAMGSGKSLAGALLAEAGVPVLHADALAHHLMETDAGVKEGLEAIFGAKAYGADGKLDRRFLAQKTFEDDGAENLRRLESIVHPPLREIWKAFMEEPERFAGALPPEVARYPQGKGAYRAAAAEIPLLFEKNLDKDFDICITVYCSEALRRKRLRERGMDDAQIDARDRRQFPQEKKAALAQVVLFNESTPDFLRAQLKRLDCRI